MIDVITEILIKRSIGSVSSYASNPDNAPKWYENIKFVKWLTERPLSVGSQISFKASFLGRELSYTYEIVEFIPNQRMVMKTTQGPFPMETTYTWKSVDNSTTRMILQNRGRPTGFARLFGSYIAKAIRKANTKDLEALKSILENQKMKAITKN